MSSFVLGHEGLELGKIPDRIHVVVILDVTETAVTLREGGAERSDGLVEPAHPGEEAGPVIVIAVVVGFGGDDLVHPLLRLLVPAEEMQGVVAAAASVHQRILLEHGLEVPLGGRPVSGIKQELAAHQVQVRVVLAVVDAEVVVLHRLGLVPVHLMAPTSLVVGVGSVGNLLDGGGVVLDGFVKPAGLQVEVTPGDKKEPVRILVNQAAQQAGSAVTHAEFPVAGGTTEVEHLVLAVLFLQRIIAPDSSRVISHVLLEPAQEVLPLHRLFALLGLCLQGGGRIVCILREDRQDRVELGILVLVIIVHRRIDGLVVFAQVAVGLHLETVYLCIVLRVLPGVLQDGDGFTVSPPFDHRAGLSDHGRCVRLVLLQHGVEDGVGFIIPFQQREGATVVERDALQVFLVVLPGKGVGLSERLGGLLRVPHILIDVPLPPMEGRHRDFALLGIVHLQGVVDVGQCCAVLPLLPVQPGTEKECLHVVRRLLELLVHEVQSLGLVILLPEGLPCALEVVVVVGLGLLGIGLAAEQGQHECRQDGDDSIHSARKL